MTKIMLVEDDKSLREIYGVRLLAEGYEIVSAGDGEEALAMAVKEHPDLILSDVMMPKISGFDMLDILRATPETKDIKIIMMTALSSEDQRSRGETLGANRYLVKSQVGIEDVVRSVHEILGDVTVPAATANQTFGAPAPSSIENTQPTNLPPQPPAVSSVTPESDEPQPEPTAPAPEPAAPAVDETAPLLPQTPVSTPEPAVVETPAEPAPAPTFTPDPAPVAEAQLPQPTAPFSTAAPSSLAENIIESAKPVMTPAPELPAIETTSSASAPAPAPEYAPVTPPIDKDMAARMSQELNDVSGQAPSQNPPYNVQ